jgi:hypothetical protein
MRIGLIIYGTLDSLSGGYLYDRKLVEFLRAQGDSVEIISLPWRNYAAHLTDNLRFRLPHSDVIARSGADSATTKQSPIHQEFDILIEDELNHPSLIAANAAKHPYPIVSLVHHLRCSELDLPGKIRSISWWRRNICEAWTGSSLTQKRQRVWLMD